jgi:tetratricopeptide (TPR) repeat protein
MTQRVWKTLKKKMKLLSKTPTKTFNLLSIGQRGVGKTVFLAGSYIELHADSQTKRPQQLWFDCQDSQVQENVERILSYVVQTGQYPPPTMKVTNFNFSLKRHRLWGVETLCHFRWWDIPGEICNMHNRDFRMMVSTSHACCVFIDAYALVHKNTYLQTLEDIIEQVMAIASLVSLNGLKYAFALLLTKSDLLEPGSVSHQQLEKRLQLLTTRLEAVKVNYQTFYLLIPIVCIEGASTLKATGAAAPLLWLVWELSKAHNPGLTNNLLELVTHLLPSSLQPQKEGVEGSLLSRFKPVDKAVGVKKKLGLYLLPTARRNFLLLLLAIVSLVGVTGFLLVDYEQVFQRQPKNLEALENLATMRQRGQFDQAVTLTAKLVQQEPERLELRLQLAELYELTGKLTKAEITYDQVLTKQNNNLKALVGKALLRKAKGDIKTASALFAQAEKAAPTDFKAQIRALAEKTLQPQGLSTPK